jgi:phosphoesterase RecJ-like protein
VSLVCADSVPTSYRFLPGAASIAKDASAGGWDAVVALDASDTQRLGSPFRPTEYGDAPVINLDHHVTNLYFGQLNYVDTTAAATAQIIVELADALGRPLMPEAATCLLTGLVTDTLGFRTGNVTPTVMATALRLMQAGANLAEITEHTLNYKPLGIIRLWGPALAEMQLDRHVLWTRITREMRARVGAPENGDNGLVSLLLSASEANVAAVFSEKSDGQVEVSLRARPGYDVAGVALHLGGGGHPQAAGCTLPGPIAAAEERVLSLLLNADRRHGC